LHTSGVVQTPMECWCQEAFCEHCIPFPKNWLYWTRPDGAADEPEPTQSGPFRHGVEPHRVARVGTCGGRSEVSEYTEGSRGRVGDSLHNRERSSRLGRNLVGT